VVKFFPPRFVAKPSNSWGAERDAKEARIFPARKQICCQENDFAVNALDGISTQNTRSML
jgi:hypothetical protein